MPLIHSLQKQSIIIFHYFPSFVSALFFSPTSVSPLCIYFRLMARLDGGRHTSTCRLLHLLFLSRYIFHSMRPSADHLFLSFVHRPDQPSTSSVHLYVHLTIQMSTPLAVHLSMCAIPSAGQLFHHITSFPIINHPVNPLLKKPILLQRSECSRRRPVSWPTRRRVENIPADYRDGSRQILSNEMTLKWPPLSIAAGQLIAGQNQSRQSLIGKTRIQLYESALFFVRKDS